MKIVSVVSLFAPLLLTGCGATSSAVTPQFIFLSVGGTEQLTASAKLSDGTTATPPSTCWSSAPCEL